MSKISHLQQTQMNQLFTKMRELSLHEQRKRREEIFQKTRRIFQGLDQSESQSECIGEQFSTKNTSLMQIQKEQVHKEVESAAEKKKRERKWQKENKTRRYWRKMLQVFDWMIEIPNNLKDFYLAARPNALKCLLIFEKNCLTVRDKGGKLIYEVSVNAKAYDGTIAESYYIKEKNVIIISDLIVWKGNPMSSSEFQFRATWIFSNLNLAAINQQTNDCTLQFLKYYPCNFQNLQMLYLQTSMIYEKQGLLFVHKDSFYIHGVNPSVLYWKDSHISKYFEIELAENLKQTKGVGRIHPDGSVRTLDDIQLFKIDLATVPKNHIYIKFKFTDIQIDSSQIQNQGLQYVALTGLEIIQMSKFVYSMIDSLSKLIYRCNLKKSCICFEKLMEKVKLSEFDMQE